MSVVELKSVSKTYERGDRAVRQVDMVVEDHEFFVIVGPSGCGKTTLLRMVAGLETVTSGDVLIDGVRVNDVPTNRRNVAVAFQHYALYPHMTVAENIGFPLKVDQMHEATIASRIRETALALQLSDVLDRRPSRLSGGQQQRAALGRAIVRNPRLLLMDEPLSSLDAKLRVQMRSVITGIQRRLGVTTMYVTHDHDEAMGMGDRLAVMRSGRIMQFGRPTDVYRSPDDVFVAQFLGTPSMNVIVASIVEVDGSVGIRIGPNDLVVDESALRRWPSVRGMVGREVALGLRADAIRPDVDGPVVASVMSARIIDRRQLVELRIEARRVVQTPDGIDVDPAPHSTITMSTDPDRSINLWEPFPIAVDASQIHLFDLTTGQALR
jgi:multiple sugar transport system ATP-binding protein